MGDLIQPWHLMILFAIGFLFIVLPFWQIFRKAGFAPPLSLLMLIPFVSLIVLYVVAFAEWPALKRSEERPSPSPPLP